MSLIIGKGDGPARNHYKRYNMYIIYIPGLGFPDAGKNMENGMEIGAVLVTGLFAAAVFICRCCGLRLLVEYYKVPQVDFDI